MEKNKIIYIVIIVVVILAIIGGGIYWYMQKQNSFTYTSDSTSDSNTPADTETQDDTAEKTNPPLSTNPLPKTSALSYSNALKTYAGRRIQFSVNSSNYCTMNPASGLVFKKGTNIMFDNRYSKPLTVYLDGKSYYMSGYGFKIVTLTTTATLPHTIRVDCGTGKNNGSILLEK